MNDDSDDQLTLGIDLGGTKVGIALVDLDDRVVASHRRVTDSEGGPERVVQDIVAATREILDRAGAPAGRLGVGVAGQVDSRHGVVRSTPNLIGWRDFPLARSLEDALDLPVAVTNDVNATTLAEHAVGAGRGADDLLVVFVGTGVGGGIVAGGRLVDGAGGYAGEIGHMTIVVDGRPCSCRNRGCLEAYVGGWAIAERAREAVDEAPEAGEVLLDAAGGRNRITAATVDRVADSGDPLARRLVEETGHFLGAGLVGAVHALNPARVVLGGGVIEGMPDLVAAAAAHVRERAMEVFLEDLEIVPTTLGADAGVIGAAVYARRAGRVGAGKGAP
ncbi:MAG: ROK family protein [Thermoanaerobaculia bacterium]